MQIEQVLNEIEQRTIANQNGQTTMKCRHFIKKLGYKARSQKLVDEVTNHVNASTLRIVLPQNKKTWMEISPDENIVFKRLDKQQKMIPTPKPKKSLYAFQVEAIHQLKIKQRQGKFKGLLVLPTGGGKTTTAVRWLWDVALTKGKKVLWLAHRHELLNQACQTFKENCRQEVTYRIVSGAHDHAKQIQQEQLLIASKDSLIHHLDELTKWLEQTEEVFIIVDEAHHATSATYKRLLHHVEKTVRNPYLLGLTATPFRTAETEQGALRALFKDGIFYKKDLKNLIASGILAQPRFAELKTESGVYEKIDKEQLHALRSWDILPEAVANQLAQNKKRNHLIVHQYKQHAAVYGKTILFAINRAHAITLAALFKKTGIDARIVISNHESTAQNQQTIQAFRENVFPILINVNILTEGADFPDVKTVFLARPTVSAIFMTQMVGRALRGEVAGGTKEAHIVSFVDEWMDKIAWSNPQVLLAGENIDPTYSEELQKKVTEVIAAHVIENLALRMDDSVGFEQLNRLQFEESVPLGIYSLHYLHEEKAIDEDILVYENDYEAYEKMRAYLPPFCEQKGLHKGLSNGQLRTVAYELEMRYFIEDQLNPMYDIFDLVALLRYYLVTKELPQLLLFKDRKQINVTEIARTIRMKDFTYRQQRAYIQEKWDTNPFLQIFFSYKELYYKKCVQTELLALEQVSQHPYETYQSSLPLSRLKREYHAVWRRLVFDVFEQHRQSNGNYRCVKTGFESSNKAEFSIAYRKSLKNGGKTEISNLALVRNEKMVTAD
ncbi:MAG: DEAD/DEAH box helicase [Kurthia sp.]|nr:DEAD/DEAH box helicase [Candidatus Kurthia equi]